MDVERMAAKRLMAATGIKVFLDVPADRPEEFATVELTGGSGDRFMRRAVLAVQSWASTRRRAAEMAMAVEAAVPSLMDEQNVFRAVANGSYRWPDHDSGQPRYQTTVELTICE